MKTFIHYDVDVMVSPQDIFGTADNIWEPGVYGWTEVK